MISIIIPVYNQAGFIAHTLDSVRAQTATGWEVIVVDDCSTDGTRNAIVDYLAKHNDPRFRLISPEQNGGVSAARNFGVAHAKGEWLAFLDGDDAYEPEYLHRMLEGAQASGAGVVHARAWHWDGEHTLSGDYGPSASERRTFPGSLFVRNFIIPSLMMCSREAWLRVGIFDADPAIQHVEDWDWVLRAVALGEKFHHINQPLVRWRRHAGSASLHHLKQCDRTDVLFAKHADQRAFAKEMRRGKARNIRNRAYWTASHDPRAAAALYRSAIALDPFAPTAVARLALVTLKSLFHRP